jgi:hypothetical protein
VSHEPAVPPAVGAAVVGAQRAPDHRLR